MPVVGMAGQFTIRFYRRKDSVLCDRAGSITSGGEVIRTGTLEEARRIGHDFAAGSSSLGCLMYGPDGHFVERIDDGACAAKPAPSRRRSGLIADRD